MSEENTARFLACYPEVSAEWLLRGEGNMLRNAIPLEYKTDDKQEHSYVGEAEEPFYGHLKKAPLIPIDIIRKQHIRVWDYVQRHKELYEMFPGNLMPDFDLIHIVRSNALFPAIEKGETIYLQRLELSIDSIVNGHTYFIDTKKNGIVIKRVFINENKLECYSLKNKLPAKILSLDDIFDIYNIVALLKYSIDNNMLDNMEEVSKNLIAANREIVQQNTTLINEISAQRNLTEKILDKLNP